MMISIQEAAKQLGVSERRVRQLCRTRRIPGARLVGRLWSVPATFEILPGKRGPRLRRTHGK